MNYTITDEGAIRLSNAIVEDAANEYIKIQKRLIELGEDEKADINDIRRLKAQLNRLKRFFRSGWYRMLTTVDGNWLIGKLDLKAMKEWEKDQKKKKEMEEKQE